jgi:hypothetical protein
MVRETGKWMHSSIFSVKTMRPCRDEDGRSRPRAALDVDLATPTVMLRRGSDGQAGLAGPYADGPSAYRVISLVQPFVAHR